MHLEKRLARGDRGINPLDAAYHDYNISLFADRRSHETTCWQNIHWGGAETDYAKDSILGERVVATSLFGYESQNENWYRLENEEEEKADEKTNITGNKT